MTLFWRMILATIPFSIAAVLSWVGIFTFVNGYCIRQLGFTNADWTHLTLWFIGAMIFWQMICTEITRRIGRVRTITLALAGAAGGYGLLGVTTSGWLLTLGLILAAGLPGVQGVAWASLVAAVGRHVPGRAIAMSQTIMVVVTILVLIGGGRILANLNYRLGFLAFTGLIAFCCWAFFLLATPLEAGMVDQAFSMSEVLRRERSGLLTIPFFIVLLLGIGIEPFNVHVSNQLYPNLMRDIYGWPESRISFLVAVGRIPGLAATCLVGHFIDQTVIPRVYGMGILIAGLGVVICGASHHLASAVAGYLIYFIGQGVVWSSNMAAVNSVVRPRFRDAAFAVANILCNGCLFITGGMHAMLLARGWSLRQVFGLCGLIGILGAAGLICFSFSRWLRRGLITGNVR